MKEKMPSLVQEEEEESVISNIIASCITLDLCTTTTDRSTTEPTSPTPTAVEEWRKTHKNAVVGDNARDVIEESENNKSNKKY